MKHDVGEALPGHEAKGGAPASGVGLERVDRSSSDMPGEPDGHHAHVRPHVEDEPLLGQAAEEGAKRRVAHVPTRHEEPVAGEEVEVGRETDRALEDPLDRRLQGGAILNRGSSAVQAGAALVCPLTGGWGAAVLVWSFS